MHKHLLTILSLTLALLNVAGCQKQAEFDSRANEIFPEVAIKYAALFRMDQLPISPTFFRDRWTVMVFASADCGAQCQHRLALLDEVKGAQALLVIDDLADHTQLRALKKDYPSVAVSMGSTGASLDNFMGQFNDDSIPLEEKKNQVYIISPKPAFSYTLAVTDLNDGDIDRELDCLKTTYQQEQ